jgi:hypothetical protein
VPPVVGPPESTRGENNSRGLAAMQPPHALSPMTPPSIAGTAPEIAPMTPPAAPAGLPAEPLPTLAPPTKTESIAAGKREYQEGRPTVTGAPNSSEFWQQKIAQDEFDKAHPWGSDISAHPGTLGKIGHTLGQIGQIAGGIVAPGIVAGIPGTRLNRNIKEQGEEAHEAAAEEREGQQETRENTAKNTESEIGLRGAQQKEAEQKTAKEATEQSLEKDAEGNVTGWKGPDGKLHSLDEEGTPQAIKDIAASTAAKPSIQKMDNGDIVQVTPGKNGQPATSNVVYHGDPKLETDLTSRTVGGVEHHILVNKKTGEDIKDLGAFKTEETPGQKEKAEEAGQEPVIGYDKDGTQRLMSRAEAKQAGLNHIIKATPKDREDAEQNASALNDMTAKVRNLRESSKAIDKLGAVQKTLIQVALRGGPDDMSTRLAVSQMSPEAKQFYQDVASLREAALALPKQTTGGARVSEVQAHALWSTVPGSAGDHAFRDSQLRKFDENTERLWRKVPAIEGNKRERAFDENEGGKQAGPPGPPDPGMKWQQNKKTGEYRQVKATP